MNESQHARHERIAAQVFAALATLHSNDVPDNARRAMLAADVFIEAFDAVYGQPEPEADDGCIKVRPMGGYLLDESGEKWWSAELLASVERERDSLRLRVAELSEKPKPADGQQTLLQAAKAMADICASAQLGPTSATGFTAALHRLMTAIAREEAARG